MSKSTRRSSSRTATSSTGSTGSRAMLSDHESHDHRHHMAHPFEPSESSDACVVCDKVRQDLVHGWHVAADESRLAELRLEVMRRMRERGIWPNPDRVEMASWRPLAHTDDTLMRGLFGIATELQSDVIRLEAEAEEGRQRYREIAQRMEQCRQALYWLRESDEIHNTINIQMLAWVLDGNEPE